MSILSYFKNKKHNISYYKIDDNTKIKFNKKRDKWITIIWKEGIKNNKCNLLIEELNFDLIKKPDEKLGYFFLESKKIKQYWTRIKLKNNKLLFEIDPKFDITPFFPWMTKKISLDYNNFYNAIKNIKATPLQNPTKKVQ